MLAEPIQGMRSAPRSRLGAMLPPLLAILAEIRPDTYLDRDELAALADWVHQAGGDGDWRLGVIRSRVETLLCERMLVRAEAGHLRRVLQRLLTPRPVDPALDAPVPTWRGGAAVRLDGRCFCFAGGFLYGPRERCEAAVRARGGRTQRSIGPGVDYVVVGSFPGDRGESGRAGKLARVMSLARSGPAPQTLAEREWVAALGAAAPLAGAWQIP